MGIDIKAGGRKKITKRTDVKGDNPYLKLLVKTYKFLARRTESNFNKVIANRLCQTKVQKCPMSLSKLAEHMKGKESKIAVICGTITNDLRMLDAPENLKVCALRFTETARKRLEKAGGKCMTFDELAMTEPLGKNTVLLRGAVKARVVNRYFGKAPGVPNSTTRPYVRKATNLKRKSRKFEQARGRRKSRGFKV